MNDADDADRLRRFERAWRESVERPAELTAAAGVQRAVELARHRRRRRAAGWMLATAAGLAALAITLGRGPGGVPPAAPTSVPPADAIAANPPEVVVMWLDPETPLYMTLAPEPGRAGGR